jgi:ADP-heptose:LPS heptosyltransferase
MSVKYLLLRFSSIGDIVLTTPVVRCLKNQVKGAVVHYAVKKQYVEILQMNPYIDKIHVLDQNLHTLIDELKQEHFDYIIDLHRNIRTHYIRSKLKLLAFSFDKLNVEKWLMVNLKINRLPDIHIVDRYLKSVELFDVINDGKGLDYFIPSGDEIDTGILPAGFQHGYVALVTGAKHSTKKLPAEKLEALCNHLQLPVVLLGGPEDRELGDILSKIAGGHVFNASGIYRINQSASLIRQASVVITHDTGLMHIAAAFRKKIISIWGNTVPRFGMSPYLPHPDSKIFEVHGLPCRPCTKIGYKACPKKHFRCMNDLDMKLVADAAMGMYQKP